MYILPEHVDVNVTPDKRQVMLHQEKAMITLVKVMKDFFHNDYIIMICMHDIVVGIAD